MLPHLYYFNSEILQGVQTTRCAGCGLCLQVGLHFPIRLIFIDYRGHTNETASQRLTGRLIRVQQSDAEFVYCHFIF
jgi:Fe-S-cluster-containing hydrogenase component 2